MKRPKTREPHEGETWKECRRENRSKEVASGKDQVKKRAEKSTPKRKRKTVNMPAEGDPAGAVKEATHRAGKEPTCRAFRKAAHGAVKEAAHKVVKEATH